MWCRNKDKWKALVETVLNLHSPQNSNKFLSGFTNGSLSSSAQLLRVELFYSELVRGRFTYIHSDSEVIS
jgi:hypothetical protein